MIGMSQIKKRFYVGLSIGLGVGLAGVLGVSLALGTTLNSYKNGTNKNFKEKYTVKVATLNTDVFQGQTITSDMIAYEEVHLSLVPKELQLIDAETGKATGVLSVDPSGLVAKYNIAEGTYIVNDMFTDEIIDKDIRDTEINTIVMPTNLVEGAYVDIRIQFPNGTDYVVLPELQVKQILNETIWFDLSESQRSILNSAIVDAYLNEGTKLYAIEYVDQTQINAFQENNEELIKGKLSELIISELPELYSGSYDEIINQEMDSTQLDSKINNETSGESQDDWSETEIVDEELNESTEEELDGENTDESVEEDITENEIDEEMKNEIVKGLSAQKAEIIYNFIKTYRGMVASTTTTTATYQPTSVVMQAMQNNPNIVNEAKQQLNLTTRYTIERLNNLSKGTTDEDEENYEKLIEGAQDSIDRQKEQRNEIMAIE